MIVNVPGRGLESFRDQGVPLLDQGANETTIGIDPQEMIVKSTEERNIGVSGILTEFLTMTHVTGVMTVNAMNGWLPGVP